MFRLSTLVTILLISVIPGIARNNSRYVDPFIGTGAVEGGLSGNNYPGLRLRSAWCSLALILTGLLTGTYTLTARNINR